MAGLKPATTKNYEGFLRKGETLFLLGDVSNNFVAYYSSLSLWGEGYGEGKIIRRRFNEKNLRIVF